MLAGSFLARAKHSCRSPSAPGLRAAAHLQAYPSASFTPWLRWQLTGETILEDALF